MCGAQYKAKESIEKHMLSHSETVEYFMCRQVQMQCLVLILDLILTYFFLSSA